MSPSQYEQLLDLLTTRPEGVCLGALNAAEPMPDYLGWLFSSFGMPRSHASWIVAIAVEEGFVELEQRGVDVSDYWLMPAGECAVRLRSRRRMIGSDGDSRVGADTQVKLKDTLMAGVAEGVLADLDGLMQQIQKPDETDEYCCDFALEDLQEKSKVARLIAGIKQWECDGWDADCLYSITVTDKHMAKRCRDASARARSRNAGKRRFSHVNGEHHDSRCLFVGGSRCLSSRIQQHLGFSHSAAYAIQMAHWLADQPLEGNVLIRAIRFSSDTGSMVLQVYENKLWQLERPLFGRMGGR